MQSHQKIKQKTKSLNFKNIVDKIQKLLLNELKLNVNQHIKTLRDHNFQALSLVELRITHVKILKKTIGTFILA
jgi:hypothetical protein